MLTPDERREMDERMARATLLAAKAHAAIQASEELLSRPRTTESEREALVRALQVAGVTEEQARQQAAVLVVEWKIERRL